VKPIVHFLSFIFASIGCLLVAVIAAEQRSQSPSAASVAPTFQDVARAAGVDFVHMNGATAEKYLAETMGSGGLFFDYNNDGWTDLFLVDGGSMGNPERANQARHRLYAIEATDRSKT
jgi:hypothetical protein